MKEDTILNDNTEIVVPSKEKLDDTTDENIKEDYVPTKEDNQEYKSITKYIDPVTKEIVDISDLEIGEDGTSKDEESYSDLLRKIARYDGINLTPNNEKKDAIDVVADAAKKFRNGISGALNDAIIEGDREIRKIGSDINRERDKYRSNVRPLERHIDRELPNLYNTSFPNEKLADRIAADEARARREEARLSKYEDSANRRVNSQFDPEQRRKDLETFKEKIETERALLEKNRNNLNAALYGITTPGNNDGTSTKGDATVSKKELEKYRNRYRIISRQERNASISLLATGMICAGACAIAMQAISNLDSMWLSDQIANAPTPVVIQHTVQHVISNISENPTVQNAMRIMSTPSGQFTAEFGLSSFVAAVSATRVVQLARRLNRVRFDKAQNELNNPVTLTDDTNNINRHR